MSPFFLSLKTESLSLSFSLQTFLPSILRSVQHESNEHVQLPVVVVQTAKERPTSTCLRICNTLSALFLPAKWSKQVVWRRVCSGAHAFNRSSRARPVTLTIASRDQACTFSREMACVPRETMRTWGAFTREHFDENHECVLASKIVNCTLNTSNIDYEYSCNCEICIFNKVIQFNFRSHF